MAAGCDAWCRRKQGCRQHGWKHCHPHALPPTKPLLLPPLQLLAWMENPVPASRMEQHLKCKKPTDIQAAHVCETYVG